MFGEEDERDSADLLSFRVILLMRRILPFLLLSEMKSVHLFPYSSIRLQTRFFHMRKKKC